MDLFSGELKANKLYQFLDTASRAYEQIIWINAVNGDLIAKTLHFDLVKPNLLTLLRSWV
jgi:hypothetical protein